jgi:hypothetical protein
MAGGPQDIRDGETKSGLAYHGVPLHFVFECGDECAHAADAGTARRLTIRCRRRPAVAALTAAQGGLPKGALVNHCTASRPVPWVDVENHDDIIRPNMNPKPINSKSTYGCKGRFGSRFYTRC